MRTLIAVMSCAAYSARRQAVRDTWAAAPWPVDVDLCFFTGRDRTATPEKDVFRLACADDYPSLPSKTYRIVKTAREYGFYRVIKVDDDTYLRLPDALSVLDMGTCVGHLRVNPAHTGGCDYPQGGCYSLSRAAMDAVLGLPELFVNPGLEDAAVGRAMAYFDIPMLHCDRITTDYRHDYPQAGNNIIAAHHVSPEVMHSIHKQLKGALCSQV